MRLSAELQSSGGFPGDETFKLAHSYDLEVNAIWWLGAQLGLLDRIHWYSSIWPLNEACLSFTQRSTWIPRGEGWSCRFLQSWPWILHSIVSVSFYWSKQLIGQPRYKWNFFLIERVTKNLWPSLIHLLCYPTRACIWSISLKPLWSSTHKVPLWIYIPSLFLATEDYSCFSFWTQLST